MPTGTSGREGKEGTSGERDRLVDTLLFGSLGEGTRKGYRSKWETWKEERAKGGLGPWLRKDDGDENAVRAMSEFIACRCFVHKNQSTTIRGYLSAIKYFHKLFADWELPTDHFQIKASLKTIDRAHANSQTKPRVRKPLSWEMLEAGGR